MRTRQAPAAGTSLVLRASLLGSAILGLGGGLAGLFLGLRAYPPTAWFAVFEVGVPCALVGALVGATSGAVASLYGRLHARRSS